MRNGDNKRPHEQTVLILAPTGRDAHLASNVLEQAGFSTYVCACVDDLCEKIAGAAGGALMAEEALSVKDVELLGKVVLQQPAWSDFPFVIFTSSGEATQQRLRADGFLDRLGNITVLERPVRIQTMVSAVESMMRARGHQYHVRDLLTEVRSLNETLERRVSERTAKLQEANRELETFAYSVSHDLRAPLRAMSSFSQMLLDDHSEGLNAEGKDYLSRILNAAKYMDNLTLDLLAYSRLNRAEFPLETVNLEDCVANVIYQMSDDIRKKNAKVDVERPLPMVLGHIAPLEQIISNLLSNGLKFTRPDVPVHIRIRAEENRDKIRVWVEDNGIGIGPQYHEKIFRIFERLFSGNTYPGTGIGLAIVKKAAERMGGAVGVESVPDQGSRFWFELSKPAAQA